MHGHVFLMINYSMFSSGNLCNQPDNNFQSELEVLGIIEPQHETTGFRVFRLGSTQTDLCSHRGQFGFRPGLTQTGLYSHRRRLEARNFGFKKKKDCTIRAAKTADLRLCFRLCKLLVFSCGGSNKMMFQMPVLITGLTFTRQALFN